MHANPTPFNIEYSHIQTHKNRYTYSQRGDRDEPGFGPLDRESQTKMLREKKTIGHYCSFSEKENMHQIYVPIHDILKDTYFSDT